MNNFHSISAKQMGQSIKGCPKIKEVIMNRLQFDPTGKENMQHFIIPFTMPSLNEYLASCNRNPHVGAKMKRENMMLASNSIRRYLKRWHTDKTLIIHYHFYEPNMKRDVDNVASFAIKTIHDSLQQCKVIDNDGWHNIKTYTLDFFVDKKNPRIEVWLEEINE